MRYIKAFNYSLKHKNLIPVRRNDSSSIAIKKTYAQEFILLPSRFSEKQYIFVDEVRFKVSMRVNYGRSQSGTPANQVILILDLAIFLSVVK